MSVPNMKHLPSLPEHMTGCAPFLNQAERLKLWHAAVLMADSRNMVMRLTAAFGRRIEDLRQRLSGAGERFGGQAWNELTERAQQLVEDTLWSSFSLASFGLGAPSQNAVQNNPAHLAATTASGVASGFIGLPGILFDIPFTTTTILRSIAEIARDAGEDLAAEDTRRACLEVLSFGGPSPADDETEIGYWATRVGANHLTIELLVKAAAARFGIVLSEKFLAQAVPVAGAITGGALNYAFTRYYQDMARITFTLRALDRRTGNPAAIRKAFAEMLTAARTRRRIRRPGQTVQDVRFLTSSGGV
jgi:hypothetical protein